MRLHMFLVLTLCIALLLAACGNDFEDNNQEFNSLEGASGNFDDTSICESEDRSQDSSSVDSDTDDTSVDSSSEDSVDGDVSIEKVIIGYTSDEIMAIHEFEGTKEALLSKYPDGRAQKEGESTLIYYYGDDFIVEVFYSNDEDIDPFVLVINSERTKSEFYKLETGTGLEEVREFAPKMWCNFDSAGRQDIPRESYHYTTDGYMITIEYDENSAVCKITDKYIG